MNQGTKRPRTPGRGTDDHYSSCRQERTRIDRPTGAFYFEDSDDDTTSQEKELEDNMSKLNLESIDQAIKSIQTCEEMIRDYRDNIDSSWKISEQLERLMLRDVEINDPSQFTPIEISELSISSKDRSESIKDITDKLASTKLFDQKTLEQEIINQIKALSVGTVDKHEEILETIREQIKAIDVKENSETEKLVQLKNLTFSHELVKHKNPNKHIHVQNDQPTIHQNPSSSDPIEHESFNTDHLRNIGKRSRYDEQVPSKIDQSSSYIEQSSIAKFYFPSLHVVPVCHKTIQNRIKRKYRHLCRWKKNGFPGTHPKHMNNSNYKTIIESPYFATWKPFGKRYMMLIEQDNAVFMLDQGDFLFFVENIRFPSGENNEVHLKDTLLDGEIVIDNVKDSEQPCYLINDIIVCNGDYVGQKPLDQRQRIITEAIINPRDRAIQRGFLDEKKQPFAVRQKTYFDVLELEKLLSSEFTATLSHKISGYYFLSKNDPYRSGEDGRFFKWTEKFSIEFLLKIVEIRTASNIQATKKIHLFLNKCDKPYAEMAYDCHLCRYDGKIVECILSDRLWTFNRERDDRPCANSEKSAENSVAAMQNSVEKTKLLSLVRKSTK